MKNEWSEVKFYGFVTLSCRFGTNQISKYFSNFLVSGKFLSENSENDVSETLFSEPNI